MATTTKKTPAPKITAEQLAEALKDKALLTVAEQLVNEANAAKLEVEFDPRFKHSMNLAERMHLVMTRVSYIQKDKRDGMKYSIVSHDKVTGLLREHTVACGIIYHVSNIDYKRDGNITEAILTLRFVNIDNTEDEYEVFGLGYGIDPGDKGPGKAISYAVKYCLLKAFGLETGDDPDHDQEVQRRSSTGQRADELMKSVLLTTNEAELFAIMREPSTRQILESLGAHEPAEARVLRSNISRHAKSIDADLSKLAED